MPFFYFVVLMAIFAVSDIISTATKAIIPSMFTLSVLCAILFWGGFVPSNILELAAIVATPPLSGGIVAYMIMSEGATAMGRPELATLALAVLVLQSFVGYPLTSFLLKREARHLLGDYKSGKTLAQAGS